MQASFPRSLTDGELKGLPKGHREYMQEPVERLNFQYTVPGAEQQMLSVGHQ